LIGHVCPAVPKAVVGDPLRLQRILVNLVGNAIKFTNRGEVVLSIDCCARLDERLALAFSVSDTGLGIPTAKSARSSRLSPRPILRPHDVSVEPASAWRSSHD
jgi:signal transduction histidine kinase